jgi:hypothetical protein
MLQWWIAAVLLVVILSLFFLTDDGSLKTGSAMPSEVQGTFTLLLHGCRTSDALDNVAILKKEGDPYTIELYAPGFMYSVKSGLSGTTALKEAEQFVRCNINSERSQLRKIIGPAGNSIGYEVRPLYSASMFGRDDILNVRYAVKERKIVAYVNLDPTIEKQRTYTP